jgi:hexulose-6-phosphate isomerase
MKATGPLTGEASDADLAAIVDLSRENGLPITSLTVNHCTGNLLDSGEAQQRSIEETEFGLRAAAKLGAPVILHTLGRFSADLYYDDAYRNAVDSLKKLAATAEKLDVSIAFEFVWNGFLFSPMEVRRFLDEIGSDHVGFYFDPGNMAVFQFPQHWVRIIGSHIKRVHLKDWKGRALNGEWTPLLEGEVDFKAVMCELRNAGYAGPLISEVAPSLASFDDTAQTMRKIVAM